MHPPPPPSLPTVRNGLSVLRLGTIRPWLSFLGGGGDLSDGSRRTSLLGTETGATLVSVATDESHPKAVKHGNMSSQLLACPLLWLVCLVQQMAHAEPPN